MNHYPEPIRKQLQQLWGGGKVPNLSPEEVNLSLKLWRKIQNLKRREKIEKDLKVALNS